MMIQNRLVVMLLEGKTLKTYFLEDKLLKIIMFLVKVMIVKVELQKIKVLKAIQNVELLMVFKYLILFQNWKGVFNKFRGHKELDKYHEGLQSLTCCKILK